MSASLTATRTAVPSPRPQSPLQKSSLRDRWSSRRALRLQERALRCADGAQAAELLAALRRA